MSYYFIILYYFKFIEYIYIELFNVFYINIVCNDNQNIVLIYENIVLRMEYSGLKQNWIFLWCLQDMKFQ